MSMDKCSTVLLAACGGAALALAMSQAQGRPPCRDGRLDKADLHESENEAAIFAARNFR